MKKRLGFWLCALLLAALALLRCADDRYVLTFNGYEIAGEAYGNPDGTAALTAAELAGEPSLTTPAVWLQPGQYTVSLRYSAEDAGCRLAAESERLLNADNSLGGTLASAQLAPGATELALPLTIKEDIRDLRLVIRPGGAGALGLDSLTISSPPLFYTNHLLLAAAVLLAAGGLYLWLNKRRFFAPGPAAPGLEPADTLKKLAPAACLLALALVASYPLFSSMLPMGHDLDFHLGRIQGIADGLSGGQFPVRLYPTQLNGKGYLLGVMYPDLFLYPAALLRLLGCSLIGSYKALALGLNLATAATAYYAGRQLFASRFAAGATAVCYTLAVYRVENVYDRAALGEALAMVFLPLVAAGLYHIFAGRAEKWPVAVIGYSGLIQAHFLTLAEAGLFSLLAGLCCLPRLLKTHPRPAGALRLGPFALILKKYRLAALLAAAGLTVLVNLWYLAPFLWFSAGAPFNIFSMENQVWLSALQPAQLFMGSVPGGALHPQMLLGPGLAALLMAGALALTLLFGPKTQLNRRLRKTGAACLGLALLALWLCTNWFPWRQVAGLPLIGSLLSAIQFPWRFLSLASVLLALCGGALAALWAGAAKPRPKALALAAAALVLLAVPATIMDNALNNPDALSLTSSPNINHTYDGQYLYQGSDDVMLVAWGNDIKSDDTALEISGYQKRGLALSFDYTAAPGSYLDLPLVWYPGYVVTGAGGAPLENSRSPAGLVRVYPTGESGSLSARYAGVGWFRLFDFASLAAILGCVARLVYRKRKQKFI